MQSHLQSDADEPLEARLVDERLRPGNSNPYAAPPAPPVEPKPHSSALDEYHKVADVAAGVNFRWKDNLYQALTIGGSMWIGVPIGAALAFFSDASPLAGALGGAFVGLVLGLFTSGIFLMVYRMFRH